jgi:mannose-6-phosphate isomerase-like protein (cupin superfamily)
MSVKRNRRRFFKETGLMVGGVLGASVAFPGVAESAETTGVATKVHYLNHDETAKIFALPVGDKGRHAVIDDNSLTVTPNRRVASGPEQHATTNHLFIIQEGEANFVTGGTIVGAKEASPGQIRGDRIEGGTVHHLTKGDVITIPANTPHQWRDVPSKSIAYYAINIVK